MQERLQKLLARAGVASRRGAEALIRQGRVTVNGRTVAELGTRADPERDRVAVDGRPISCEPLTYILLHKPRGVVSTARDPRGRPTVVDLVGGAGVRLYPVGRLDYDSSGLLLLTNDGELAHALTHPRHQVEKVYRVRVKGHPSAADLDRLRRGVPLDDGVTAPASVREVGRGEGGGAWLEMAIREGRNRQVRRMLAAVGHEVTALIRIREGGLSLGRLRPGAYRPLTRTEVARLYRAAGLSRDVALPRDAPSHGISDSAGTPAAGRRSTDRSGERRR